MNAEKFYRELFSKDQLKLLGNMSYYKWSSDFYLAAGSALILHLGHRQPMGDFDFFTTRRKLVDSLKTEIVNDLQKTYSNFEVIHSIEKELRIRIEKTEVEFLAYGWPLLKVPSLFMGIKIASLVDLGLMKLSIALYRLSEFDLYDLYEINKNIPLDDIITIWANIDFWPEMKIAQRRTKKEIRERLAFGAEKISFQRINVSNETKIRIKNLFSEK